MDRWCHGARRGGQTSLLVILRLYVAMRGVRVLIPYRDRLLSGPPWREFTAELRATHLGEPAPERDGPSVRGRLAKAHAALQCPVAGCCNPLHSGRYHRTCGVPSQRHVYELH